MIFSYQLKFIRNSSSNSFAHWTYQATKEYLIVNDLQGFRLNEKQYFLTDPAISSPEGFDRFSTTNLSLKGIKRFFRTHQCNHICKHLKLIKHRYQILPDRDINILFMNIKRFKKKGILSRHTLESDQHTFKS
ncbi:elongation factor 2 [Brachionus plicatilis]|uniref:Elongation factor 2 n=1 Tax=Brachionus plicatilis TaxID=10195 RepID=A0A3M7PYZ0_BRAPC|nr:elongation factor 2 [Brachionus plicatilis]